MKTLIILLSIIVLIKLVLLCFAGVFMLIGLLMKKILKISDNGWKWIIKFFNGRFIYILSIFSYIISAVFIYFLSTKWFIIINFSGNNIMFFLLVILGILIISKISKLKNFIENGFD